MLSRFGKTVRKLRIDKGVTLKAMAETLGKTSAYLSAVETGRKNPPDKLVRDIAAFFELPKKETEDLKKAAQESRSEVNISMMGFSDAQREVAAAFARQFSTLTEDELEQIRGLLKKKHNN
ncbi:MAG TPA: XRE family transcriptional regulator [Sedimenticola sp.]|nr:XRE family transcriptional regulator [Sedimenticola sp.]